MVAEPTPATAPRLRRVLGPVEVTASGVGIIIGAGIYVLLGAATGEAGNAVWLSFVAAAVLCGLTGLSYAELASMFPNAGAEYDSTRRVFPERWAFLVGWTMVVGLMVAAAAIAVGFAQYLSYFVDTPIVGAAIALLVFDTAVALTGIHRSARLTLALSAVQVLGLLIIIVIGATHLGDRSVVSDATLPGVMAGAALVFFAFIGFDEVITLAEETRHPTKVIPRALLAALGISAVLYVAVAIAAVSVIGADALAGSSRPLADVMAHVLGGRAEGAVALIALITTTNTSLLALTAASRLTYGMADTGALPGRAAILTPRTGAPSTAIVVVAVGAIGFATIGDLTFIASVTNFAVYVVFLAVNAAVVVLRRTAPDAARPFRTPGAIRGIPILPIAGSVAALAMVPQLEARSLWLGLGLLALGMVAYRVLDRREHTGTHSSGSRPARLPPRWFIVLFWHGHRALVTATRGRLGLWRPKERGWGTLRLITVGRRTGRRRAVLVGYLEDGDTLTTMAMNGWGENEPSWWLNLQAHPETTVQTRDGIRAVRARRAEGAERARLWAQWAAVDKNLDSYAARRPGETAVVVFERRD